MPPKSYIVASLVLATCLTLSAAPGGTARGATLGPRAQDTPRVRAVREIIVPDLAGTRSEYFRLDLRSDGTTDTASDEEPLGLVRWVGGRSGEDPRGWRNEQEVFLFEQETQISLVEQLSPTERELSYREIRARTGRRQHLTWTPDGAAQSSDSDGRTGYRREFDLTSGAALPLALLELARRDQLAAGTQSVFAPRGNAFETLTIHVEHEDDRRRYELRFADGTSAGSYRFRGRELLGFHWQSAGVSATRITEEEFLARKKRFAPRRRPIEELAERGLFHPVPGASRDVTRGSRD